MTPALKILARATLLVATIFGNYACQEDHASISVRSFFVSTGGNDSNEGSYAQPWQTIGKVNSINLAPGDTVHFGGGQIFKGTLLLDSMDGGTSDHPIVLTSFGSGLATIQSDNLPGLYADRCDFLHITKLRFEGSGRKEGNTRDGVTVSRGNHILLDSLEVQGYQKSGVLVFNCHEVTVQEVYAHNNGFAGISISGNGSKADCSDVVIRNCFAENNPGDPTNLTNHSGNGIIVGLATRVAIEYCSATNNGWDMPRQGNGPVGIWAYESDSVTIAHCISYRNKTSDGGEDGGGFDLDGGVTHSVIEYCLSYENAGSGFGIFQYAGASPWRNNTVRFNLSVNDGLESTAHAGIYFWNGSGDEEQFSDCFIYNNVIWNSPGAVIHFNDQSKRMKFHYYNNIFVTKGAYLKGASVNDEFLTNDWWTLTGQPGSTEQTGLHVDPGFEYQDSIRVTDPHQLASFLGFRISAGSPLRINGTDLQAAFGIDTGQIDFAGNPAPHEGIGASF